MEIILIFCCIRNYFRARAAKLNAALWSFYTLLAILVAFFIACLIAVIILMMNDTNLMHMLSQKPPDQQAIFNYLRHKNLLFANIFIAFAGIGGYLFVRHHIIKRTNDQDVPNDMG